MSDAQATSADGQSSASTAVNPQEGQSQQQTQPETDWKAKYEKAESDLGKVREFYKENPKAMQLIQRYVSDKNLQKVADSYLETGKFNTEDHSSQQQEALESLDPDTRRLFERMLDEKLGNLRQEYDSRYSNIERQQQIVRINEWRQMYTKQNGWAVDFREVEPQIAEMLQQGRAVDAESAYKILAADKALEFRKNQDREIGKLKTQVAMSRGSVPRDYVKPGKDYQPKTLEQAFMEALEEQGIDS